MSDDMSAFSSASPPKGLRPGTDGKLVPVFPGCHTFGAKAVGAVNPLTHVV